MAAITSVAITAAATGASLYMSARQAKKGADQAKEAKEALDKYKRQKLENPYSDLRVSTMSADLAREEAARNYMGTVNALQSSGLSGLSLLPQMMAGQNTMNRQIGADLDRQFVANENQRAGGRAYVQNMQEQREIADLAGLGVQQWVGEQNRYTGLQNMTKALPMFASSVMDGAGMAGRAIQAGQMTKMANKNELRRQNAPFEVDLNSSYTGNLMPWTTQSFGGFN